MTHDIECTQCDGEGIIWNNADPTSGQSVDCDACHGEGWREPTADEASDMAEAQWHERNSGEPPMTMREQNTAAWMLKQALMGRDQANG